MTRTRPCAARVLIVEDEEPIRDSLATAYRGAGHDVHARADGTDFEDQVDAFRPDLVVLDVMLPGRDGFALARALRERAEAAVLFLTARDDLDDRLRGFAAGADDYVVKPFAVAEVLARSAAALRRLGRIPATVQIGDVVLDHAASVASRDGTLLELTATEWRLLSYLAANRGRTLSKTQILTQVWGYDDYDPNLVEVHVSALRRKTEALGPRVIHTVRGLGYVLRP
ncbi:DNA-binding response regulator, OmpR family, contains REC and winged-helix (wHTH) domain [Jatrophihabitans endophyticus]|uniref:DNA-binding response regulator, OmpR family, contains REC and winged-helix (WHTH) domain n=1 Tax=Jatrophihabitans endophyticus TaxID=1206085 RepID=A0A1M5S5M5_9ACTN|nr:response regulator transcription factor [Jatrophihabitans endophyticus]SHH33730.1 DNA-binding response regulator, OmpR family, contains REC and winged-helix (wHTH) domain [Jatrophihabitans endophyticus]